MTKIRLSSRDRDRLLTI